MTDEFDFLKDEKFKNINKIMIVDHLLVVV